jgi:hypothetical protein
MSTSSVERQILCLHQEIVRLVRKTPCFSKRLEELRLHLELRSTYATFVRPHHVLREPMKEYVTPQLHRKWRQRTPEIAAGLADCIWTLREFANY